MKRLEWTLWFVTPFVLVAIVLALAWVAASNADFAKPIPQQTYPTADHYASTFAHRYNTVSRQQHAPWRIDRIECSWSKHVKAGLDCKIMLNRAVQGSRCGVIGIDTRLNLYFSHGVRCAKIAWRAA